MCTEWVKRLRHRPPAAYRAAFTPHTVGDTVTTDNTLPQTDSTAAWPQPTAAGTVPQMYQPGSVAPGGSPIGKIRNTGTCMLLCVLTLGIYSLVWWYQTHDEMKRHTGDGMGGGLALVLSIFVGIVMPFVTASEVGRMYQRRGQHAPVNGATGLWYLLLGWFFLVGAVVWFVKVNGALNAYWRSQGAR